jgi:serine/threonine protein kinase
MRSLRDTFFRALRRVTSAPSAPTEAAPALRPADADAAIDSGWPRVGGRVGPFQLDAEIGRGTVGRVYRARLAGATEPLALKTLMLAREFQGPALDEARIRFFRQAHAARRLNHPDIVSVLDTGESDGVAWLSMPLLHGHSLERHTRPGSLLGPAHVVQLGARVARALAHAHAQGVVHRDVKPANIVVDLARAHVTVTDFGIAWLADAASTRTGLVLGSPAFMSPEQLAGRRIDGRSDLYALGVTLYQLLTGRLPHAGQRLSDLMSQIANEVAPDVREARPELPEALAHVLALSLEKRPELRYADGLQLAEDLDAVAAQWPADVPEGVPPSPPKLSAGAGLA